MTKTIGRIMGFTLLLALAACGTPQYLPTAYAPPAPPPLQPYVAPPGAYAPAPAPRRRYVHRHRYVRRHYVRQNCPCIPPKPPQP